MLSKYIQAAMRHAKYEILSDDGTYYGEIPECRGVYANSRTLEECRNELAEVLEGWILFRIHKHLAIPVLDGLELTVKKETAALCLCLALVEMLGGSTDVPAWNQRGARLCLHLRMKAGRSDRSAQISAKAGYWAPPQEYLRRTRG